MDYGGKLAVNRLITKLRDNKCSGGGGHGTYFSLDGNQVTTIEFRSVVAVFEYFCFQISKRKQNGLLWKFLILFFFLATNPRDYYC